MPEQPELPLFAERGKAETNPAPLIVVPPARRPHSRAARVFFQLGELLRRQLHREQRRRIR